MNVPEISPCNGGDDDDHDDGGACSCSDADNRHMEVSHSPEGLLGGDAILRRGDTLRAGDRSRRLWPVSLGELPLGLPSFLVNTSSLGTLFCALLLEACWPLSLTAAEAPATGLSLVTGLAAATNVSLAVLPVLTAWPTSASSAVTAGGWWVLEPSAADRLAAEEVGMTSAFVRCLLASFESLPSALPASTRHRTTSQDFNANAMQAACLSSMATTIEHMQGQSS